MKKYALALAALAVVCSSSVSAQTCTANAAFPAVPPGPPVVVNGDSCTATNQLNLSCSDANPIGAAADFVYSFTAAGTPNGNASLAPTGWDAYLAIMSGACSSASVCPQESEAGGNGVTEMVPFTGLAPGNYFLLISSFAAAANCGPFTLTLTPTLPVTLQNFSIE